MRYLLTDDEFRKLKSLLRQKGYSGTLPQTPKSTAPQDGTGDDFVPGVSRAAVKLLLSVYGLVNLYENILIGLLRRKSPLQFVKDLASASALRLALAVSAYSAAYRLLLARLRRSLPELLQSKMPTEAPRMSRTKSGSIIAYRPHLRDTLLSYARKDFVPPFVAAAAATPAFLLEGQGQRRVTLSIYALVRGLQALWAAGAQKDVLPAALKEGRWWFGPHLIFALSNAVLLHNFVFDAPSFPANYGSFILKYSGAYLPPRPATYPAGDEWPSPRQIVDAIAESAKRRYPIYITPVLHPEQSKAAVPPQSLSRVLPILDRTHPAHDNLVCAFLHPETTDCKNVFQGFVLNEFKGAAKFFSIVSLVGMLVKWKKAMKHPDIAIFKAILSTVSSSAFLALSIGTAWSTICLFQTYLPRRFFPTKRFYLQGFLAGLWVSLTTIGANASRATELGLYTARMAIQSQWEHLVNTRRARNIKHGELFYLALSLGALVAVYETQPTAVPGGMTKKGLGFWLGESTALQQAKLRSEKTSTDQL